MYKAIFKCRLCGEISEGAITGNEHIAMTETINTTHGIRSAQPMAPHILEEHNCEDGSYGVADFQGFKFTEE